MTKLQEQLNAALSVLGHADYISLETVEYINAALIEKALRKDEVKPRVKGSTPVSPDAYVSELADRAKRLSDKGLGHFVKATLWTATDKVKKGEL